MDLNPEHLTCRASALPTELQSQMVNSVIFLVKLNDDNDIQNMNVIFLIF